MPRLVYLFISIYCPLSVFCCLFVVGSSVPCINNQRTTHYRLSFFVCPPLPCLLCSVCVLALGCVLAWFLGSRRARALAVQMVGWFDLTVDLGDGMLGTGVFSGRRAVQHTRNTACVIAPTLMFIFP
ncbi:hypothetical protein BJ912DRAFT_33081 [Pholiota molesta]|nr:hypothetical protein BJ912DRAFT_33081 [Pholiota molesta]